MAKVKILLDGVETAFGVDNVTGEVVVDQDRLYKLINLETPGSHVLEMEFEDDQAEIFAFTFG